MTDERVILIAGAADGRELTTNRVMDHVRIPVPVRWSPFVDADPFEAPSILDYDLMFDDLGQPSRDDEGRLRYMLSTIAVDPLEHEWRLAKYFPHFPQP